MAFSLLSVALAFGASAQTEAPLVVENELYAFEFTVEQDSVVTYREGGTGFTCVHNSAGGAAGYEPDYGLVVFGRDTYGLSAAEARATGLGQQEVQFGLDDVDSQQALDKLITAQMKVHERGPAGYARVTDPGGGVFDVPYFTWQRTVGPVTHHALMYVTRHATGFILVQVESTSPLTGDRLAWLTGKLVLRESAGADEQAD
ncbi:MAG TPA: hypothetical protein ENO21_02600 [Firmicutes bacterium]|nr:hypothetical protein [Bacillota bacterium]